MSGEQLGVTAGHLRGLSQSQSDAAQQIGSAGVHGVSMSMWVNHGVICAATSNAISAAEQLRETARSAMKSKSSLLSDQLLTAAGNYDDTDGQQAGKLGEQLHPR